MQKFRISELQNKNLLKIKQLIVKKEEYKKISNKMEIRRKHPRKWKSKENYRSGKH